MGPWLVSQQTSFQSLWKTFLEVELYTKYFNQLPIMFIPQKIFLDLNSTIKYINPMDLIHWAFLFTPYKFSLIKSLGVIPYSSLKAVKKMDLLLNPERVEISFKSN